MSGGKSCECFLGAGLGGQPGAEQGLHGLGKLGSTAVRMLGMVDQEGPGGGFTGEMGEGTIEQRQGLSLK